MINPKLPAPDSVPAVGDPGDETARRYRYQWTYAAIVCCILLDEAEGVAEVFCEHHEDVLLKHVEGDFSGFQIKTRASDQEVWRTSDEAIKSSCIRFARLEAQFPGWFRAFRFLTNHPLHSSGNGQDFRYVLRTIRAVDSIRELPSSCGRFLARIARDAECDSEVAFTAMSKTEARDDLPKLPDIELRLVSALTETWARAADCSHASVVRAARSLASECGRASSLVHEDMLPAYLSATADPTATSLSERIAGKRMDKPRVLQFLERGLNERATLNGDPQANVRPGGGAKSLLLKKLDAGGFSAVSCNSAVDLRHKADYLGLVWLAKHGNQAGLQRYEHVRSLVLRDAATAFEATKNSDHAFGFEMLSELRSKIQQRQGDGSQLYDCSAEHLEGVAYSLTSECLIQWSLDRPWESE